MRRQDYGMAATPVGKQAEEYKFFCPLCMMFYRTMREMPCCKQYICAYCLVDFLQTKQSKASPRLAAAGGEMPPTPDEVLPRGVACPHCASIGTGQPLRVLDSHNTEEARSYLDSPGTKADLIGRTSSGDQPAQSPLKVGDDFQTMARKMLPFEVGAPEAAPTAAPPAVAPAAEAADVKTSEVASIDHQLAAAATKRAEEGSPRVEQEAHAAGSGEAIAAGSADAIAAGSADVSGEVIAAA